MFGVVERTQIYLTEEQQHELARRVAASGRTKSDLIREALDAYLETEVSNEQWRRTWLEAIDAAFGAAPYLSATYVEDLRTVDAERQDELERRWRG
jgi:Arc/MetJ-type ribon-helix-helix transcriptional regulator